MQLAPEVEAALPAIQEGLPVRIGPHSGALTLDAFLEDEGQAEGFGLRRLSNGTGPVVKCRLAARELEPGIELDLVVTNGETENAGGAPTEHIASRHLIVSAPPGMAVVSRFPWIRVFRRYDKGDLTKRRYRVDTGYGLDQCGKWLLALALVPHAAVEEVETKPDFRVVVPIHPVRPFLYGAPMIPARVRWMRMPDNLERPFAHRVTQEKLAKARNFILTGDGIEEESYNDADWGALTGGGAVRFDEFAEYEGLTDAELFLLCWRWYYEVLRRPQRGFLTKNGEPLEPEEAADGFNMTIGPTEELWPNASSNPHGFERMTAEQRAVRKGAIDAQHGKRWWAPIRFLTSQFGCWLSREAVALVGSALRLDHPNPLWTPSGQLGRAEGWIAELQATQVSLGVGAHDRARVWLERYVEACQRDQTDYGGLCRWTHNKEAKDYARQYVWSQMSPAEQPADWRDLPIEEVTRPEQEMILQWGLHCTAEADVPVPAGMLSRLGRFIHRTARGEGRGGPWERCTPEGKQRSPGITRFYSGTSIVLLDRAGLEWLDVARDYAGGDELAILGWSDNDLRNAWHLQKLIEPF